MGEYPPSQYPPQPGQGPLQGVPGYSPLDPRNPNAPPPPAAPPHPGYYPAQPAPYFKTQVGPTFLPVSGSALWARRLAIAGIILTLFSGGACAAIGIVPLILSYVALSRIRESGGALGGEEMAKTGRTLSWIMVGWTILQVVVIAIVAAYALAGGFNSRPA